MKSKAFFKKIKIYYEAILIKTLSYWHKDKQANGRDQKKHKQTNAEYVKGSNAMENKCSIVLLKQKSYWKKE